MAKELSGYILYLHTYLHSSSPPPYERLLKRIPRNSWNREKNFMWRGRQLVVVVLVHYMQHNISYSTKVPMLIFRELTYGTKANEYQALREDDTRF